MDNRIEEFAGDFEEVAVELTQDEMFILCLLAMLGASTMSRHAESAARLMAEIMDETAPGPDVAKSAIRKLAAGINVTGRGLIELMEPTEEDA